MAREYRELTGREVRFGEDEIIVSKTDLRGVITYANDVFQRVSGYTEAELLGAPHNLIRHPHMPRCVFKLLWDTLEAGEEIFAYVLNLAKSGDHYWVFAHVTPSFDLAGKCVGYHSNRRVPHADALEKIKPLYAELLRVEKAASDPAAGMRASFQAVVDHLTSVRMDYSEFVFGLSNKTQLAASVA